MSKKKAPTLKSIADLIAKYEKDVRAVPGVRGLGGSTVNDDHWLVVYADETVDIDHVNAILRDTGVRVEFEITDSRVAPSD